MRMRFLAMLLLIFCTGCLTDRLSKRAVHQAGSDMDLRYHEVLFNLAMIAEDSTALPVYAPLYAATPALTGNAQISSNIVLQHLVPASPMEGFNSATINPTLQRQQLENWSLDPILVPEKLEAMRCACQWVIHGPDRIGPECLSLLGKADDFPPEDRGRHFGVLERLAEIPPGWLHCESRRLPPLRAAYKARCGERWAWVMPEDVQALADFTLIMQNIARVDINSLTLFSLPFRSSPFTFQTRNAQFPLAAVDAAVFVDERLNLVPDNPYFRWRVEAPSSNASLRTQISAAGLR